MTTTFDRLATSQNIRWQAEFLQPCFKKKFKNTLCLYQAKNVWRAMLLIWPNGQTLCYTTNLKCLPNNVWSLSQALAKYSDIFCQTLQFAWQARCLIVWPRQETLLVKLILLWAFQNTSYGKFPLCLLVSQCFVTWPNIQLLLVKQMFGKQCLIPLMWTGTTHALLGSRKSSYPSR